MKLTKIVGRSELVRSEEVDQLSPRLLDGESTYRLRSCRAASWGVSREQSFPMIKSVFRREIDAADFSSDGFVCNGFDSSRALEAMASSTVYRGYFANLEGVLDEGLSVGLGFELVDCFSVSDAKFLDSPLSVGDVGGLDYWIFEAKLPLESVLRLLDSSVMGYQVGFSEVAAQDQEELLIVRNVGVDISSTDLFLTRRNVDGVWREAVVSWF